MSWKVGKGWMVGGRFLCNDWFNALCHSFLVSPSVELSVAGRGEAEKGGSCVLIPDLVVMEKFGYIAYEMKETFMEGDGSSQRLSWYWTYCFILFHPSSSAREMKQN
nr:hypothetical protein [Tanacetum cinerariifolium]